MSNLPLILFVCLPILSGCKENVETVTIRPIDTVRNTDSVIAHYSELCRQNQSDSLAYSYLGWAYLAKWRASMGYWDKQEQLADSAISVLQKNLMVNRSRSDAYADLGYALYVAARGRPPSSFADWSHFQIKKARRLLGEAATRDPLNAHLYYYLMGESFLVPYYAARVSDAGRCFERAIEIEPNFLRAYLEAGKCYVRLGQYTKAHQAFFQALKLGRVAPSRNDIDAVAGFYQHTFRPSSLLESYMAQLSFIPAAMRWPFGVGLLLFQKNAKDAASTIMKVSRGELFARSARSGNTTATMDPIDEWSLAFLDTTALSRTHSLMIAISYLYQKRFDDFVDVFTNLDRHQVIFLLGGWNQLPFFYEKKEFDRRLNLLSRLSTSDQRKNSYVLYCQSKVYRDIGKPAEALRFLKRAAEADQKNVDALRDLAVVYERQRNYRSASDAYEKMRENEGNLETWASAKIAVLRKKSGDLTGAMRMFDKVLQDDPELRDEEFTRGNNFSSRGEVELAREAYEIAAGLGSTAAQDSLKKWNIKW